MLNRLSRWPHRAVARALFATVFAAAHFTLHEPARADDPPPMLQVGALPSRGVSVVPDQPLIPGPGSCEPSSVVNFVQPTETLAAAFYFPWHVGTNSCPNSSDWCTCFYSKPGGPEPHEGYYSSSTSAVVHAHLNQMQSAGVDIVAVEWTNFGNLLDDNLRLVIVPALAGRPLQYVLLYDAAVRLGLSAGGLIDFGDETTRTLFASDLGRFASEANTEPYFKNSKYLKLDGKPVIYLYVSRAIIGSEADITTAFNQVHAAAVAAGFSGLHIVADQLFWGANTVGITDRLRWMNVSAVSSFGPLHETVLPGSSGPPMRVYADKMAAELYAPARDELRAAQMTLDINPGVFVQFDETASQPAAPCIYVNPRVAHLQSGEDWSHMITNTGVKQQWVARWTTVDADCNVTHDTNPRRSIIWIYSFNEWGEGTGFERLKPKPGVPAYPYAFDVDLIDRTAAALGGGSASVPPQPPGLSGPDGSVEGLRPVFLWDEVPAGSQYNIRISVGGSPVVDTTTSGTDFRPSAPLAANVAHTWRVRAKTASSGYGAFSTSQSFTPRPVYTVPPGVPTLVGPSGCVGTLRPTLSWLEPANTRNYKLLIAENATGNVVYYQEVDGLSFTPSGDMQTPNGELQSGVEYRFRVKALNSVGETWATSFLFFTPMCNGKTLSVQDASVAEGDAGTVNLVVPVTLSAAAAAAVTVSYSTSGLSATPGVDYQTVSGVLTFPVGVVSRDIVVPVVGDRVDESTETFKVTLSSAVNAAILDAEGHESILDDDESPHEPHTPQPASGTVWNSLLVDLSWVGGDPDAGDTVTYDLYFGTVADPPLVAANLATTSRRAPLLRLGTPYYWRILARDQSGNITTSNVWTLVVPPYPYCTVITAVPYVIADSGRYCLDRSLETNLASGAAISIEAEDVTLDLMGFTLRGPGFGTAAGVASAAGNNVVVRNGSVAGFARGVSLTSSVARGYVIERIEASDHSEAGIWVAGAGSLVRSNRVAGVEAPTGSNGFAYGIAARGTAARILENEVMDVVGDGTGFGYGISLEDSPRGLVQRNRIGLSGPLTPNTYGIAFQRAAGGLAVANRLTLLGIGISAAATTRFRDNLTLGCTTPYVGGTDVGNNQ